MMAAGRVWWRIVPVVGVLLGHASIGTAQASLTRAVGEPTTPSSLGMQDAVVGGADSALMLAPEALSA